ncbi:FixJ family two-component response regulator [Bradyrhizobium sp. S3.12.5]
MAERTLDRAGFRTVSVNRTSPRIMEARIEGQVVLVVDDDASVRKALTYLFESMDLPVRAFTGASELLKTKLPDVPRCLVLDIRLPGGNGLEFQDELLKAGIHIPIVFLTAHGDIPMSVKAMKAGAIDFLTKPCRDQDMLDAVTRALDYDRKRRTGEKTQSELRHRYETLTPREQEVMALAASGLRNKQIAYELAVEVITVKIHRGRAMKKMAARSIADMVSMAAELGLKRAL